MNGTYSWKVLWTQKIGGEGGWRLGVSLVPVTIDQESAPDELLKVIRCNCLATLKNLRCEKQCSCCSNGRKCVAACGGCRELNVEIK